MNTNKIIYIILICSALAHATNPPHAPQRQFRQYLIPGIFAGLGIAVWAGRSRLDSEESPVRENGLTEGALRYPNLIWALTKHERERPKVISEEKRSVLILGPGAPSVPLKAVHQLHELAPFFMNDKISVVDNSEKVISAIKNSYLDDFSRVVYNNIINNEENFEGKDKSLLQDMLRNHLTLMPSTLEHLPLDLISIDFTELSLRYDSLDVLVATKSLCHAVEKESRIVGRYVTALKVGGIAFLALEEFDTFIHAVSGESQTHFDALIQIKEALKKLKYRVHLSNGMDFKVEIIEPFSTARDPSRRGWAIWYERPGFKKRAFISTSPIFKFIRTK